MLELHDIEAGYGAGQVLFGVSLAVTAGACVSLMGRNGMGKTTTVRAIMGQLPLTSGRISRFGDDRSDRPSFDIARSGIGLVPEGRQVFSNLNVRENLQTFYRPPSDPTAKVWTYDRVLALFPGLAGRSENAGNHLSGGEQQMLATGRALCINPSVLLLDEPTEGLQPSMIEQIRQAVTALRARGVAILLVEQRVDAVLSIADRVVFLENGRNHPPVTTAKLEAKPELLTRFVGV